MYNKPLSIIVGYLMTTLQTHSHATTFECVDAKPEYIAGTGGNLNGALFYFVKPICSGPGSINYCGGDGGYINDRQLTCVVCSK